ncbi:MAG: hypothetical protein M3460_19180 [Actinomycetota bacterium]|nr:hypothetical protein [Actinomycetota bacterium]
MTKDELEGADVREQHRIQRLKRGAISTLATLLVLAVTASLIAFRQYKDVIRQRDYAIFSQIIAQAERLRDTDVSLAAQLHLTAYRIRQTPDLYTALLADANAILTITSLVGHTNTVNAVGFSPDGHTLVTGSDDQTVRLWNVTDPSRPTPLGPPVTGHTNRVRAVAFSPDGRTLATGSDDQTVRLWNVTDPSRAKVYSYTTFPWTAGSVEGPGRGGGMVGCRGGWGNQRRCIAGFLGLGMRIRRGWIVRSGCVGRSPIGLGW